MKFEDIKGSINKQKNGELEVPKSIKDIGRSQLPIQRIRKTMLNEIGIQFLTFILLFSYPFIWEMHQQPRAIYLILMFVACIITSGYLIKMVIFFRQTGKMNYNSKTTISQFIFDLKLLLEIYKTAIIAGSILLPVPIAAFFLGQKHANLEAYNQLFSLQFPPGQLILLAFAYIALALFFYYITIKWSNWLYVRQINNLEKLLVDYE